MGVEISSILKSGLMKYFFTYLEAEKIDSLKIVFTFVWIYT